MNNTMFVSATDALPDAGSNLLWRRQLIATIRIELKRILATRRSILFYFLAAVPIVLLIVLWVIRVGIGHDEPLDTARHYPVIFSTLVLGTVVFFGCALVFTNLIRGDLLNQSLHYYFLAAVRRELLVLGKYIAALIATSFVFGLCSAFAYLAFYLHTMPGTLEAHIFDGAFFANQVSYIAITVLGCFGYGAVFLAFGVAFRNAIIPIGLLLGWELIHFALPPVLKLFTVYHYLRSLMPIPPPDGPFAVVVEQPEPWLALVSLLLITAIALGLAVWSIRKLEIHYVSE